jgi:hypothetical protein
MYYGNAYHQAAQAASRANAAASNVDPGSARLNNFNNTGAAQSANAWHGQIANAEAEAYAADAAADAASYVNWERSLQDRAMSDRERQTANAGADSARKWGAQGALANAVGGAMGGGLLSGLTTSSAQKPAVNLYGSNGGRIGGTPLAGLA